MTRSHIDDDVRALQSIATMLRPGGRAVVLVPALRALYGSLDRELGHYRRYSPQALADLVRQGGFHAHRLFYFNAVGALGWWANAKLLRKRRISRSQLELFDALVPLLRLEDQFRFLLGQSLIAVAAAA